MWTTDLNPQALCTSPDSLGSSNYLTSFCVGLGANWEHELTHVTVVLFSLLPPPLPGALTPPNLSIQWPTVSVLAAAC